MSDNQTAPDKWRTWAIVIPGRGIGISPNYTSESEVWSRQNFSKQILESKGYKAIEVDVMPVGKMDERIAILENQVSSLKAALKPFVDEFEAMHDSSKKEYPGSTARMDMPLSILRSAVKAFES